MLDACVACGRCEESCPAFEAGKPLSPKQIVQDILGHLNDTQHAEPRKDSNESELGANLHGDVISAQTLWSCTTCSACVDVCPLGISPLGMITDMRRFLVGEAELRGAPAVALQKSQRTGNPWGLPPQDRFNWASGLSVPTVADKPDFDVLYWVGCAASYDRRAQKVARAVVQLLQAANVNFAVLGNEERCTGEAARRMGDEFLFQELAEANLKTLSQHQVKTIVTHCPHCLNSLLNDYSQFGGHFTVQHHSQFLADLLDRGLLPVDVDQIPALRERLTYHDPCYLARVNQVTESPRRLLEGTQPDVNLVEMPRRERNTACCGAGGGRMWFDDGADQRIGMARVHEALETGAETIAVSCPFCLTMMTDGVSSQAADVNVRDIAELLADAIT